MQRTEHDYTELRRRLSAEQLTKLRANHFKVHWRTQSLEFLLERLADEVQELRKAVIEREGEEAVWSEAADVSNLAAMIADRYNWERS